MGYTHYWYRDGREIKREVFERIVNDFKKLLPMFKVLDIKLAGPLGDGEPVITNDEVIFNGSKNCGHPKNDAVVIPWPAETVKNGVAPKSEDAIVGSWFAGVLLLQRTCNGDCSYETFYFPRVIDLKEKPLGEIDYYKMNGMPVYREKWQVGKYFHFCKTAFRPYDLAVQCFLVIAKHHLGNKLIVSSDGDLNHWMEAITICKNAFGYKDFVLNE